MRTTCTHPHNQARSGFVSNISSLFELATLANDS